MNKLNEFVSLMKKSGSLNRYIKDFKDNPDYYVNLFRHTANGQYYFGGYDSFEDINEAKHWANIFKQANGGNDDIVPCVKASEILEAVA